MWAQNITTPKGLACLLFDTADAENVHFHVNFGRQGLSRGSHLLTCLR